MGNAERTEPLTVSRSTSALRSDGRVTVTDPLTDEYSRRDALATFCIRARTSPLTLLARTGPPSVAASTPPLTLVASTSAVAPATSTSPFIVVATTLSPAGSFTVKSTDTSSSSDQ